MAKQPVGFEANCPKCNTLGSYEAEGNEVTIVRCDPSVWSGGCRQQFAVKPVIHVEVLVYTLEIAEVRGDAGD